MSISTILLISLFIGLSLFSKAKKTMVQQGDPQGHSAVPGEGDDDAEIFEEDESPYFTYESDIEEPTKPHKASKAHRQAPVAAVVSAVDEPVRPQFDLRQAVIGQVILNNRYLDEINQQNQ